MFASELGPSVAVMMPMSSYRGWSRICQRGGWTVDCGEPRAWACNGGLPQLGTGQSP